MADALDHRIIGFVERFIDAERMCPKLEEIAAEFDMSVSNAHRRVKILCKQGWLQREPHQGRSIRPGPRVPRR